MHMPPSLILKVIKTEHEDSFRQPTFRGSIIQLAPALTLGVIFPTKKIERLFILDFTVNDIETGHSWAKCVD